MRRLLVVGFLVVALMSRSSQGLSAQWNAGLPGADLGSLALQFGQLMPQSEMTDGAKYESGAGFGLSLNYWPFRHYGLRTAVFRGKTKGKHGPDFISPVGFEEPAVWMYTLEGALRFPFVSAGIAGAPYLSAGIGGKSYRWANQNPRIGNTNWVVGAAGGLELRPAGSPQYGLMLEARFYRSKYAYHGYQADKPTQDDIVISAGVSLHR